MPAVLLCGTVAKRKQNAVPQEGAHGMRSRFLPVDQLDDETFAPRIVQVCVCELCAVCVFGMDASNCCERVDSTSGSTGLEISFMCVRCVLYTGPHSRDDERRKRCYMHGANVREEVVERQRAEGVVLAREEHPPRKRFRERRDALARA